MKTIRKRVLSLFTAMVMVCSLVVWLPSTDIHVSAANTADSLVAIAEGELGKTDGTKYAKACWAIGGSYNYAWCAAFVSWCARQAGVDSIPTQTSCYNMYNGMINKGCHKLESSETPQRGDIVFFYCTSCKSYQHVGIMVDSNKSIDGNYGSKVSYDTTYSDGKHSTSSGVVTKIYVRPNYDNILPPTNLSISTNRRAYAVGENVTFSFNSQNSSEQYIPIDVNGVRKHFIDVTGKTQYTTKFTEPGIYSYTLYVRNSVGEANVEYKTFFVGEVGEMITPTITTDKKTYCPNENIHISWQKTGATTDFANYWLIITEIASNKEVYGGNAGSSWNVDKNYYDIKLSNSGMYYIAVYSVPWNNKDTRQKVATTKISVGAVGEMTTPTITTDKKTYYQNENVHISWNKTSVDTDFAEYWLIIKDLTNNKEIYGGNAGSSWNVNKNYYDIKLSSIGEYSISVYAVPWNNKESRQKVSKTNISVECNHKTTATAAKAATCTADGNTAYWYCPNCKKYFSDSACTKEITLASTVVKATGHKWNNVTYTWSTDNKTCIATRVCANNSSHNETETVNTTYSVTKKPTYTNKGTGTYTATFKNTAFAKQTKDVELQPIPTPTPKVPELTATATEDKVTLKWKPIANAEKYGIAGYVNEKWKLLNECYTISYELKNLKPGTEYKVAVVVMFDGKWNLDFSNAVEFTTPIPIPKITYEKGNGSVKLTWNTVSGAQKYGIAGYQNGAWQLLDKTTGSSYTLKNLKAGTNYKVTVIAMFNSNWNMDFSNAITVTPNEATVSQYPVVQTQVKDSKIGFKWNKIPGVEKYGIGMYQANKWKVIKQLDGNVTTWTSPQVRNGTYRLVVLAKVDGQWVNADVFKKAFYVTVS